MEGAWYWAMKWRFDSAPICQGVVA